MASRLVGAVGVAPCAMQVGAGFPRRSLVPAPVGPLAEADRSIPPLRRAPGGSAGRPSPLATAGAGVESTVPQSTPPEGPPAPRRARDPPAILDKAGAIGTAPRPPPRASQARPRAQRRSPACRAQAQPASIFAKIGRTLKEKAERDFGRLQGGTEKTRQRLSVVDELLAYWSLEDADDTLEELEDALITADFGPATALKVVDQIRDDVRDGKYRSGPEIKAAMKAALVGCLEGAGGSTELALAQRPAVVFVVGVNGGGKTTTIGKMSSKFAAGGAAVTVVPGDTFRAAAAEQLATWAERAGARMAEFKEGQKPSGVLFDAVRAAQEDGTDVVLCDTSGRLHTNDGLMQELAACKKAIGKAQGGAPEEVLLVLDGTTGLNMINQAKEFHAAVGLTGLILTKLDGTARGGAVVSVVDQLKVPVKFVGVGEGIDDLQAFDPAAFVEALFPEGE